MPIEIKELQIRINVDDNNAVSTDDGSNADERKQIIEACVEQVMEILEKKQER